jgi:heme oxygenase
MKNIRESIKEIHEQAEKTLFAQSLVNGTVSKYQWDTYLFNWMVIHKEIEERHIIKKDELLRTDRLFYDLIDYRGATPMMKSTIKYLEHLKSLEIDKLWSHVYVHYLGHLYGGQHIRKKIMWSARCLQFDDHEGCIKYIRDNVKNADHDEAILAFEWVIKIYEEISKLP